MDLVAAAIMVLASSLNIVLWTNNDGSDSSNSSDESDESDEVDIIY